jgi:hypothetical protein
MSDKHIFEAARNAAAELRGLQHGEVPTPRVTFEPSERQALDAEAAENLVSMTFKSRSGSTQPHIVTLHADGSVTCTCPASNPCWGSLAFRKVKGLYG